MTDSLERLVPEALRPDSGERGLLNDDLEQLRDRIARAWQIFGDGLDSLDLAGPTRAADRTVKDQVIPLGAWPDSRGIHDMVADAHAGRTEAEAHSTASARLRSEHGNASDQEVRDSIRISAARVDRWFSSGEADQQATAITPSALGPIPVATYVHAALFQLAATWRDIKQAPENPELDELGLTALVDSTGAVVGRLGATASITAVTPQTTVGTGAHGGAWRTRALPDDPGGPGVVAPAGLLIDVAAGQVDLMTLARQLRVRQPKRLAAAAIVLDGIPELPAAAMLRRAARLTAFMAR